MFTGVPVHGEGPRHDMVPTGARNVSRATLVIVDDDRSFVEAVSIFLEDHGYRAVDGRVH